MTKAYYITTILCSTAILKYYMLHNNVNISVLFARIKALLNINMNNLNVCREKKETLNY